MAIALKFSERVAGGGFIADSTTGNRQNATFGGVLPSASLTLTTGTDSFQAENMYLAQRALAATTYDLLDLAGGLSNFGGVLTFTEIVRVYIAILEPDGTKSLQVGPQGQSNAWIGPFGDASDYVSFKIRQDFLNPYDGWAVGAGATDILGIYNPGASSLDYAIMIIGRTS